MPHPESPTAEFVGPEEGIEAEEGSTPARLVDEGAKVETSEDECKVVEREGETALGRIDGSEDVAKPPGDASPHASAEERAMVEIALEGSECGDVIGEGIDGAAAAVEDCSLA